MKKLDIIPDCDICGESTTLPHRKDRKFFRVKGMCQRCYGQIQNRLWYQSLTSDERQLRQTKYREYIRKLRLDAINHLGGKCACCGINEYEFLTFDHVNNDGSVDRRENGRYLPTKTIMTMSNPGSKWQVLCWNCNEARAHHKVCPHKKGNNVE